MVLSEQAKDSEYLTDAYLRQALLLANTPEVMELPPLDEAEAGFSEVFEARMDGFLKNPFRRPARPIWQRCLRTVACFLLVLAIAGGAAMLHPAARAWVSNIVIGWYDDNMDFRFQTAEGETPPPGLWLPTYIPAGYVETMRHNDFDLFYDLTYENDQGLPLYLDYSPASGTAIAIDNEHGTPEVVMVDGREAHLMRSFVEGWPSQLIWTSADGTIAFHLSGQVSAEELLQMAQSLEKQ